MSQMGKRLRIWKTDLNFKAYKDQFGIEHEAYLIIDEVDITIVATRDVKGNYGGSYPKRGYKAISTDGRIFFQNWNSLDELSMNSSFYWHAAEGGHWENAEQRGRYRLCLYEDDRTTIGNPNVDE